MRDTVDEVTKHALANIADGKAQRAGLAGLVDVHHNLGAAHCALNAHAYWIGGHEKVESQQATVGVDGGCSGRDHLLDLPRGGKTEATQKFESSSARGRGEGCR